LATEGEGHVQVIAPPMLQFVKKGWRSGKPDAPGSSDGEGELFEGGEEVDPEEDDVDTPEAAMARAHAQA
jgi:hypothetical protein